MLSVQSYRDYQGYPVMEMIGSGKHIYEILCLTLQRSIMKIWVYADSLSDAIKYFAMRYGLYRVSRTRVGSYNTTVYRIKGVNSNNNMIYIDALIRCSY